MKYKLIKHSINCPKEGYINWVKCRTCDYCLSIYHDVTQCCYMEDEKNK